MGDWIDTDSGVRAYRSGPVSGDKGRVLLLHAWWGLNPPIVDLADRLGGEGFAVLAPDLFDGLVLDSIETADTHVAEVEEDWESILAEVERALDTLLGGEPGGVAVVGFSFGAAYGHLVTSKRDEVAALVDFYAGMGFEVPGRPGGGSPAYLGHFAADDPYEEEDPAGVPGFDARVKEANPLSAAHLYPDTTHWFFEADRPEYHEASAQRAFRRTVEFLTEALRSGD